MVKIEKNKKDFRKSKDVKNTTNDKKQDSMEDSDSEEIKIHVKKNGFATNGIKSSNTKEDDEHACKQKELAGDVKSQEAQESGAFENFDLPEQIVKKLKSKGINYLYPIQVATLKHIRAGNDVIAQARTGTGKTMAFGIPIVEKLENCKKPGDISKSPKCLVLEPTRELAKQVGDDFTSISTCIRTCCVYGGVAYERQQSDLNKGVDVLAGTPGRILDFINSGSIDLGKVDHVILDEVDRMLDMGFQDSVEEILKNVYTESRENKAQTLFFSATCPPWVKKTAQKYMGDEYKFIDLIGDSRLKVATTVEHLAIQCSYQDRASTIGSVLQVYSGKHGRAMIFCQTKKDADELACSSDIKQESHVLHGDVPQDKRELVLKKFRDGKYKVLITTDVAARGLDIPEVDLVICCSPPKDYESYVHRSGRTGRAGRTGVCVCFYKHTELNALMALERNTGTKFKRVGAPSSADIVEASTNDAAKSLDTVSVEMIEKFRTGAEEVLKTKDAVNALAAALAVISGCTKVTQRSLLTSKQNFTTYMISKTDEEIRGKSFAYAILKKIIGEENGESAIAKVVFTKDKMGLVFDVSSEFDDLIQEKWFNTKSLELKPISELPEIEEEARQGGGGFGGFRDRRGGDRGSRGGGFRSNGRNGRGGKFERSGRFGGNNNTDSNKRKFDNVAATQNKRIKFDE